MIFLFKDIVTGEKVDLPEQKEYIVGRKNCDILLENDQSISRKHAVIRVKDDHVTLEDCKSKYHTLHNGVEVDPNVEIRLKHMDLIQFGALNSKFCFEAYQFITAASALSAEKKAALKESLAKCNGKYVEKWSSSCTHLTVEKITLTIKVLQALIDEKPIVMLEYWLRYAQSLEHNTTPPDINNFCRPPVAEQLLKSDFQYKLDPRRKTLFNNKIFVFLKRSMKIQMSDVIKSCGGDCIAWDEDGPITFYEIQISPKEYLIIKADSDDENVSFNAILKDMAKQNKRAIPLNEIALAIVHCSTEINCNPNFNKVNEVFGARTQKQQTMGILAAETETERMIPVTSNIKTEKIIPPSLEDDWAMTAPNTQEDHLKKAGPSGVKRSSATEDNEGVFKKPKTEEKEPKIQEKENVGLVSQQYKAPTNFCKNTSQLSQKRKAIENLEASSPKKLNPFSKFTSCTNRRSKVNDENNPFELTRTSNKTLPTKSSPTEGENPFARTPKFRKSTDNVEVQEEMLKPKREPRKEFKLIANKSVVSVVSSTRISVLNTTWMSKNTSTIFKTEIKEEHSELLEIAKAFKNCVKIEVLPVYIKKDTSKDSFDGTSFDSVDGRKSFKKFKKVEPAKPQVTIIPRNQLTKIGPGDLTGIVVGSLDSEDDEAGPSRAPPVQLKEKRKVKKFVL